MGSPLSTTPNFAFLCLLVTENCVPNCLLAWCRHICCLMVCLHAPLRIYKCLSDWNQASQAVIQGNKPVFSLSDLELLTCPHQRIDLISLGPPHPTHTPWLTSFSSFSTFSSPYTSRRSDFKTPPPPWTFIPNSTEVSSSLLLNPTFFDVVQLPCTLLMHFLHIFPSVWITWSFLSTRMESLQTQILYLPYVLCLPWWVAKCMVMLNYKMQLRKSEVRF